MDRKKLRIESGSGALNIGLEAVKLSFLLNGAGAVALLGLLAADNIREVQTIVIGIAWALTLLSIGAALAPLALLFAFFAIHAQYNAVSKTNNNLEARLWIWKLIIGIAAIFGISSVSMFIYAVLTLSPILALKN